MTGPPERIVEKAPEKVEEGTPFERTEAITDPEKTFAVSAQLTQNARKGVDTILEAGMPRVVMDAEPYVKLIVDMAARGLKLRCITEITRENIDACKQYGRYFEVRHLDGVRANFSVSDTEYIGTSSDSENNLSHTVYSNARGLVRQNQYLFETLWSRATRAKERYREIEEGAVRRETRIVDGPEDALREMRALLGSSRKMSICATHGGIQFAYKNFFDVLQELVSRQKEGRHEGTRYVTFVDGGNVELIRKFLDAGIPVRHVAGDSATSFWISDKEVGSTISTPVLEGNMHSMLVSNESLYREHYEQVFEEMWNNGVDAEARIRDIQSGALAETDVILNPGKTRILYKKMVSKAEREVLLMIPTASAFERAKRIGVIEALEQASANGVMVRILGVEDGMQVRDIAGLESRGIEIRQLAKQQSGNVPNITMAVIDGRESLVIELKDDDGREFEEAAGPAVISVRGSIVVSHARVFESLWREAELIARLQETDRLQREFVNVAAHELKTPIQPILVTAYLLDADEPEGADEEEEIAVKRKYLSLIFRNAKRLQQLSSNILEVARLESQSFRLHRQRINIRNVIQEELRSARSKNSTVEWRYEPGDFFVDADEGRLAEVMANLLSNAARFTEKGMISVTVGRHGGEIIVRVADTGSGIHPEIMPRLFQKYASKSDANTGTGLGLFISKSIIEAHGGRIWAENSRAGGSAFSFSLPAA